MSDAGKGAAVVGAGLLGALGAGARLCDDAARVGRLGGEAATVGRVTDDLARLSDDGVAASRLHSAGQVAEEGGTGRWMIDEADAIELTVDIGLEALGELSWDTGAVPLTPPIAQLSGLWAATDSPPGLPEAWMCALPPEEDHRACGFVYRQDGRLVMAEGLLVVREGVICRTILSAPAQDLHALNRQPCDQIITSDGTSLVLSSPAGAYRMIWSGTE